MERIIKIFVGEMVVGHNDIIIQTGGVGSCVVISLYDHATRIGGMVHAMLPGRKYTGEKQSCILVAPQNNESESVGKYVDEGIDLLLKEMISMGAQKERVKAKIVGGAKMFKIFNDEKREGIGERNIRCARQKLLELNIPIEGEELGGSIGREVEMNLENGVVSVNMKI
jgi:chemotaxis protein CheD